MTRQHAVVLGVGIVLAACAGAPAPRPAPVEPEPVLPPALAPAKPERAERPPPLVTKLNNGLMVAITASPPGAEAQLQLAVFTGRCSLRPASPSRDQVLIEGADPSQGRRVSSAANLGKVGEISPTRGSRRVPGNEGRRRWRPW
jgi:hypothetical protein